MKRRKKENLIGGGRVHCEESKMTYRWITSEYEQENRDNGEQRGKNKIILGEGIKEGKIMIGMIR